MGSLDGLGSERLEGSTRERELGVLLHGLLDLSQQCLQVQRGLSCSALHWCSLTSRSWDSFGHLNVKKTPIREHPKEALRTGKGLEGKKPYEITWFVQLEETEGRPICGLQHPPEGQQRGRYQSPHSHEQ